MALQKQEVYLDPLEEVERAFAHRVAGMASVKQVISGQTPTGLKVWTIIEAAPGDREAWRNVYQAEMDVLDLFPDASVEFRLINLAKLPDSEAFHVPQGKTVYERRPQ